MCFGPIIVSKGKKTQSTGINLGESSTVESIGDTPYKYLGILQDFVIQSAKVKRHVLTEYYRRCKKVISSKLDGRNKCITINSFALPIISYTGSIVK